MSNVLSEEEIEYAKKSAYEQHRIALAFINTRSLAQLFMMGTKTMSVVGLPEDAVIHNMFPDQIRGVLVIQISSKSYEVVPEGGVPPRVNIDLTILKDEDSSSKNA